MTFSADVPPYADSEIVMSDEALIFSCDEAACHLDARFYETFDMDERWAIIRAVLNVAAGRGEKMREALETIGGFRKVNLSGEYEHGLRDIIRSITDCAQNALYAQ